MINVWHAFLITRNYVKNKQTERNVLLTKQQRTTQQTRPGTLRPTESKYSFIISLTEIHSEDRRCLPINLQARQNSAAMKCDWPDSTVSHVIRPTAVYSNKGNCNICLQRCIWKGSFVRMN